MRMLDILRNPQRLLLFCFEGALAGALFVLAACLRLGWAEGYAYPRLVEKAAIYASVLQVGLYYAGHYDVTRVRTVRATFRRVVGIVSVGSLLLLPFWYVVPQLSAGRGIFVGAGVLTVLVAPAWRGALDAITAHDGFRRRALVLGDDPLAKEVALLITERPDIGLELVGAAPRDLGLGAGGVADLVRNLDLAVVLVDTQDARGRLPVGELVGLKLRGVDVEDAAQFYERHTAKVYLPALRLSDVLFGPAFAIRRGARRLKRLCDIGMALSGLAISSPLMMLVAIAIVLESRGPILFKQVRAGEFGDPFTMFKFRSMRMDAERSGAQMARENDPRVTRIGRVLRRTRMDELPQLWNVLRGDMSLVGPRPERPVFIEQLAHEIPFFGVRLYVKPGITGHAQVRAAYAASAEDMAERLRYDLYYVKNSGLLFDLSILVDTVKVVLFQRGSR
jgi:sugar transferase (PEP-CTERM system associated)